MTTLFESIHTVVQDQRQSYPDTTTGEALLSLWNTYGDPRNNQDATDPVVQAYIHVALAIGWKCDFLALGEEAAEELADWYDTKKIQDPSAIAPEVGR